MTTPRNATTPATREEETKKEEARRGLLRIMIDKFSSTPLQEEEYTAADEIRLRNQLAEERNDIHHDAALTVSEREYLSGLLKSGDTNSIQSASAVLRDEHLFPKQQQLQVSSSSGSSTSSERSKQGEGGGDNEEEDKGIVEKETNTSKSSSHKKKGVESSSGSSAKPRRDSVIQQQLFRLHETEDVQPSELLQRMNFAHQNSILADESERLSESSLRFRSTSPTVLEEPRQQPPPDHHFETVFVEETTVATATEEDEASSVAAPVSSSSSVPVSPEARASAVHVEDNSTPVHNVTAQYWTDYDPTTWNPFEDINSWLDGSQGVEVTGTGIPQDSEHDHATAMEGNSVGRTAAAAISSSRGRNNNHGAPFRILGTSADDVSCHPHVLSPPLMESLLAFVPEYAGTILTSSGDNTNHTNNININDCQLQCQKDTTTNDATTTSCEDGSERPEAALPTAASSFNFWLKYSLVRDGATLWTFLRQVRASTLCFLAIETDEGHVFGAFTSQPWRLSKGWYGSKDTFLWKMRRSRLETTGKSIVQQVCQESEIQVYPYRTGNAAVQYCSKKCLMLGQGEIIPSPRLHNPDKPRPVKTGKHYGYALYLDKDLTTGTTSSSETFGNPCLIDPNQRGARFQVANIEVWTLTPHDTVSEAEQSELSNLFLDGGRDNAHRLNFMNILVGGPI